MLLTALASAALGWLVLTYDRESRCAAARPGLLLPSIVLLLAVAPAVVARRTAVSGWLGLLLTAIVVVALTVAFDVGQPYDCFFATEEQVPPAGRP